MKLKPEDRIRVILNQIVPAIIDHGDKSFQLRQLETQEGFANHLNEVCKIPIADLPQYFADAREEIRHQTKEVERIEVFV